MANIPDSVHKMAEYQPMRKEMDRLIESYSHDEGMTRPQKIAIIIAFMDLYTALVGEPDDALLSELKEAKGE